MEFGETCKVQKKRGVDVDSWVWVHFAASHAFDDGCGRTACRWAGGQELGCLLGSPALGTWVLCRTGGGFSENECIRSPYSFARYFLLIVERFLKDGDAK